MLNISQHTPSYNDFKSRRSDNRFFLLFSTYIKAIISQFESADEKGTNQRGTTCPSDVCFFAFKARSNSSNALSATLFFGGTGVPAPRKEEGHSVSGIPRSSSDERSVARDSLYADKESSYKSYTHTAHPDIQHSNPGQTMCTIEVKVNVLAICFRRAWFLRNKEPSEHKTSVFASCVG